MKRSFAVPRVVCGLVVLLLLAPMTVFLSATEASAVSSVAWYSSTVATRGTSALAVDCVAGGAKCASIISGSATAAAYSTDSGRSWHNSSIPTPSGWFPIKAGINCVGTSTNAVDCAAIVELEIKGCCTTQVQGFYSHDAGATWSKATFPTNPVTGFSPPVVRCFGVGLEIHCVGTTGGVSGTQAFYSHNGGATWTASAGMQEGSALSCVELNGVVHCVDVGAYGDANANGTGLESTSAYHSIDGGINWTAGSIPGQNGWLTSVDCAVFNGQVDCAALGTNGNGPTTIGAFSTDGGQSWQTSSVPQGFGPFGTVSCYTTPSGVGCAANLPLANSQGTGVGGGLLYSSDGGASWAAETDPSHQLGGVDCLPTGSSASCYGVGYYSADGGKDWAASLVNGKYPPPSTVEGAFTYEPVSCTALGTCAGSTATMGLVSTTPPPRCSNTLPAGTVVGMAVTADGKGYWIASNTGQVTACGDAAVLGNGPAGTSAIATAPSGNGYWLVTSTGVVKAFGSAVYHGEVPTALHLAKPIVAIAADPATAGYWLLAGDGGVFSYNAPFYGSTGNIHLNQPAVGLEATPNGRGYRFVASDGGIFDFGNAPFYGSMGAIHLNKPVVGMADDPATGGYWLDASDGGIFSFKAPFYGSTGNITLAQPCVGMTSMPAGNGYRFVAADGGIFDFGAAPFEGSAA
jgi:hypothetical protein